MAAHSLISPSMIHRIVGPNACHASVLSSKGIPDAPSPAAEEGTQAHDIAETHLRDGTDSENSYIQDYLDYVRGIANGAKIGVEMRFDLGRWIPDGFGTADAVVFSGSTLHVIDLKYGQIKVEAYDNPQLKTYALGAVRSLHKRGIEVKSVELHIAQPRIRNFDTFSLDLSALLLFGQEVKAACESSLKPGAPYNPTESNCRYCRFAPKCAALHKSVVAIVSEDFEPLSPKEMSVSQIITVLKHKKMIETWLDKVSKHSAELAESGYKLQGYKLVEGRTQRRWNARAEEVLVSMLGDDAFDKKLIGLTAAKKLVPDDVMLSITNKPPGKITLVETSDPRPEVETALSDFKDYSKGN